MQTRLFSMFCMNHPRVTPAEMDRIFKEFGIWNYIEECYDTLHTEGDEAIYDELSKILQYKGAKL